MPIYPGAVWRPIPEYADEPRITPTQLIFHTAVSQAESLYPYWSRPDVTLESHLYVGQRTVEQYQDTGRQADANHTANVRAISVETWDNRDPEHTPWTPWQMDQLVAFGVWACRIHLIPARFCPAHDQPGIGWHSMWGAPSPWTPVRGKTCPGGPRIAQMPELLARIQAGLAGRPTQEDDMTPEQAKKLDEVHAAVFGGKPNEIARQVWALRVDNFPTSTGAAADYMRRLVRGSLDAKTLAAELAELVDATPGTLTGAEVEAIVDGALARVLTAAASAADD